ncbi:MAG TPA: hypothetical protein VET85_13020 [Stellaceae bacterium]|nr:hypothetical protein [Stellaceae bacterium]
MSSEESEPPAEIARAINLLWTVFWIQAGQGAWIYATVAWPLIEPSEALLGAVAVAAMVMIGAAFTAFFLRRVRAGRRWARILVAIGFAVSIPDAALDLADWVDSPLWLSALSVIQIGAYGYAVVLLFGDPGGRWYAARRR